MPPGQRSQDYTYPLTTRNLPNIQQQAINNAVLYDALKLPQHASRQRRALFAFRAELNSIAAEVAKLALVNIKQAEIDTRVRPDTQGDGGPRLNDYVGQSHPLPGVPGSVGMNFTPPLDSNVPWWWTNEWGYSGHIGRVVHGFFFDAGFTGRSRPDPGRFREHPLFRAEGPQSGAFLDEKESPRKLAKGTRPGMLIKRPIPSREFVRKGGLKTEATWHTKVQAAESRLVAQIEAISKSAQSAALARRRPGRRKRP